jgi:hypothetical protein
LNLFEKRFKTPKTFKKSRKRGGCVGGFNRPSVGEGLAPPGFSREESVRGSAPDLRLNLFEKRFKTPKTFTSLSRRENFMPLAANFTYTGGVLWSSGIFLIKTAPPWA